MFSFLNTYRWLLYGGLVLAIVGGGAVLVHRHDEAQQAIGEARVQAKWDAETKRLQAEAIAEAGANAKETQRRLERQKDADDANAQDLARNAADAADARNAADRLRGRVGDLVAAARRSACNPAPAAGSTPAADPAGMLADLQRRADERAGILAQYGDAARSAGLNCERRYDALTPPK